MNLQTSTVTAPPAPRSLDAMLLPMSMMRDILIKTMFRMNLDQVSQISRAKMGQQIRRQDQMTHCGGQLFAGDLGVADRLSFDLFGVNGQRHRHRPVIFGLVQRIQRARGPHR